jgi:hypothetical protein
MTIIVEVVRTGEASDSRYLTHFSDSPIVGELTLSPHASALVNSLLRKS